MKIRSGYVSNSSSSSFVVVFPRKPKSVVDLRKMLFGDKTIYAYMTTNWQTNEKEAITTKKAAETVWADIKHQKRTQKNQIKTAKAVMRGGVLVGYEGGPEFPQNMMQLDKYRKEKQIFAEKIFSDVIINTRKRKLKTLNNEPIEEQIYIFSYADEDGSYFSALEHGGLFEKLRHIVISNH